VSKIDEVKQQEHTRNYLQLIQQQKTLLISSVSAEIEPECSYAPYVIDSQGIFYIFVSDLAVHTKNMLQNSKVSVLFIQPESDANNLFARERVVFNCKVREIQKTDKCFDEQLQHLKHKFGETVALLSGLADFHLLSLTPINGKYIAGFGQAFKIDVKKDSLKFE
jgi:putative heme iron utilization protein